MRYGYPNVSVPPADPVAWRARRTCPVMGLPDEVTITERTWFAARALAMVALQAEPFELEIVRTPCP
jgi:hypothetical protein